MQCYDDAYMFSRLGTMPTARSRRCSCGLARAARFWDWEACDQYVGLGWLWERMKTISVGLVMAVWIDGLFVRCLTCPRSEKRARTLVVAYFSFLLLCE